MRRQETLTGYQDLDTGLAYDHHGKPIVPDPKPRDDETIVQTDQLGVYRRTIFSSGRVETIQTLPIQKPGPDGRSPGKVPLPGEQQDVSGTGQDEATQPKVAPSSKSGPSSASTPKTANK